MSGRAGANERACVRRTPSHASKLPRTNGSVNLARKACIMDGAVAHQKRHVRSASRPCTCMRRSVPSDLQNKADSQTSKSSMYCTTT
eukprot:6207083-Pleurochrysis_carterae.AAC.2